MKSSGEALYHEVEGFVGGSVTGFVQLIVAAARKSTFERIIACPTYPVPVRKGGLGIAVEKFCDALKDSDVHAPTFLAKLYASARSIEHRKRHGQFFTSVEVAEWALSLENPVASDSVCDAGAGAGAFADAVVRGGWKVKSYVGVENDPILALCAAHVLESLAAPANFKVWYANFLLLKLADFKSRGLEDPTLLIANPPFVRFHNLSGRARIRKDLRSSFGLSLSSLSGSGNYFLSRAAELLTTASQRASTVEAKRKRMLFFLPKEAEGSAHAKRLRIDLEQLHGWRSRQMKVPANQTGIDRHPSNALALFFVFQREEAFARSRPYVSPALGCLQDIVRVKRGISTGCNDFFVLTDKEVRERRLPRRYLRAVLPTRIPMKTSEISDIDWDRLRTEDHACWLLALPPTEIEDFVPAVQDYLREGLQRGLHETPTAKTFKKWFSVPLPVSPPNMFITYLFRSAPRFVLNQARLLHLTNILGGRFTAPVEDTQRQKIIIDALNELSPRWMKNGGAGREYKGGLFKIEPGELSMLPLDQRVLTVVKPREAFRIQTPQLSFDSVLNTPIE